MNRPASILCILTLLLGAATCANVGTPEPAPEPKVEAPPTPPPAPLIVAEEFGPLMYRISPELRPEWDRVLELHQRLFNKQEQKVGEDDLHRLYDSADANDDDVLDQTEVDEAFRRAKREYERYLQHGK